MSLNQSFKVEYEDLDGCINAQVFPTREEAEEFIDNLLTDEVILSRDSAEIIVIGE